MKGITALLAAVAILSASSLASTSATAQGVDDPARVGHYAAFKGKRVVFVPIAMGFDLTEGWAAGIRSALEPLGVKFDIRDPNWNTDAGAQAITSLIAEKPDAIVVHNPDVQSYARLLKRAEEAGIYVIQVNMRSSYSTDGFAGADYVGMGERIANRLIEKCGPANGGNGKIAIMQGVLTAAASAYQMKGLDNVLSKNPQMKVVANQAADWDATKARSIMATVLQQHPDLCGGVGFWDVMDVGTGAAIRESGKKVHWITQGGGNQAACDNLSKDVYSEVVSYDVPAQARDIANIIQSLFQNKPKPGTTKTTLFSPLTFITKDNMKPGVCWSLEAKK